MPRPLPVHDSNTLYTERHHYLRVVSSGKCGMIIAVIDGVLFHQQLLQLQLLQLQLLQLQLLQLQLLQLLGPHLSQVYTY